MTSSGRPEGVPTPGTVCTGADCPGGADCACAHVIERHWTPQPTDFGYADNGGDGIGMRLLYAGGHCHAPACLRLDLFRNDTGEARRPHAGAGAGERASGGGGDDAGGAAARPSGRRRRTAGGAAARQSKRASERATTSNRRWRGGASKQASERARDDVETPVAQRRVEASERASARTSDV